MIGGGTAPAWQRVAAVALGLMATTVEPALAGLGINHCEPAPEA